MLEKIVFNSKRFKYRAETEKKIIVYDTRYGTILFLTGNTKDIIEASANNEILVDSSNEAIKYLLNKKVIVRS